MRQFEARNPPKFDEAVALLRRPGVPGAPLPARAILSMTGLSHGVIRVNTEDKNSALTVQDVGHVMPGGEAGEEVDVFLFFFKNL